MTSVQAIIFTDMDGSLLDHETYSHAEADECLAWLRSEQIPVVPVTSKTRAEVLVLRQQLNNHHPFIIENGAAVLIPKGYFAHESNVMEINDEYDVKTFVESRSHWQALLAKTEAHLNEAFISFQQAGIDGVMEMTGLSRNEARLASQREYGEPLKWLGSEDQFDQFNQYILSQDGQLLRGGRFVHLSGDCDKGQALRWLLAEYQKHFCSEKLVSIALGDSQNDTAMLEAADHAIIIRSPVHNYPAIKDNKSQQVYKTKQQGPCGWTEGVTRVLTDLGFKQ